MVQNADGNVRRTRMPNARCTAAKKTHTDKNLVLVNTHSQKVVYLSPTQPGKKHDKKQADEAAIVYPRYATLGKDTGFQGYEPPNVLSWQPKKKPKARDLEIGDVLLNGLFSLARIVVEHTLAGAQRCHIVKTI